MPPQFRPGAEARGAAAVLQRGCQGGASLARGAAAHGGRASAAASQSALDLDRQGVHYYLDGVAFEQPKLLTSF